MLDITNHNRNATKTTIRQHFTPASMAMVGRTDDNTCSQEWREMGTLCAQVCT